MQNLNVFFSNQNQDKREKKQLGKLFIYIL